MTHTTQHNTTQHNTTQHNTSPHNWKASPTLSAHSHHSRLKPVWSTRMPRNGETTAEMIYTRLLRMLAWSEEMKYLSIRNTL